MIKIRDSKIKILAIETSCDETAAAVIGHENGKPVILSSVVSSQIDLHAKTGGVVPEVASRAHMEAIVPVVTEALLQAGNPKSEIPACQSMASAGRRNPKQILNSKFENSKIISNFDIRYSDLLADITHIAVTSGPGLIGSLLVGFNAAKSLAYALGLPIIPINHIEGHIFSALCAEKKSKVKSPSQRLVSLWLKKSKEISSGIFQLSTFHFPLLALVVSGGHTSLIHAEKPEKYVTIGATLDDAAGEAFDKVAKLLDLGYPGGPVISKLTEKWRNSHQQDSKPASELNHESRIKNYGQGRGNNIDRNSYFVLRNSDTVFPRPLLNDGTYNFSFSGLKTAVLYEVKRRNGDRPQRGLSLGEKAEIAAAFEAAVVDVLVNKTMQAIEKYKPKTVILAGGVAANRHLRETLASDVKRQALSLKLMIPPLDLCGDNAAMIGLAAYSHASRGDVKKWSDVKIDSNWEL